MRRPAVTALLAAAMRVWAAGRLTGLAVFVAIVVTVAAGCGAASSQVAHVRLTAPPVVFKVDAALPAVPGHAPAAVDGSSPVRRPGTGAHGVPTGRLGTSASRDVGTHGAPAGRLGTSASRDAGARGAPTDAEVRAELRQGLGLDSAQDVVDTAGLTQAGLATVPPAAPRKVGAIIAAANQVARSPYVYGGGHGGRGGESVWVDSAYDCSGSVSFALAAAGLADAPMDSSTLARWGRPGPGRWVTIYANAGHAFMVVAGLRFDTVERARTGTRWGAAYRTVSGFTVRHPAGL